MNQDKYKLIADNYRLIETVRDTILGEDISNMSVGNLFILLTTKDSDKLSEVVFNEIAKQIGVYDWEDGYFYYPEWETSLFSAIFDFYVNGEAGENMRLIAIDNIRFFKILNGMNAIYTLDCTSPYNASGFMGHVNAFSSHSDYPDGIFVYQIKNKELIKIKPTEEKVRLSYYPMKDLGNLFMEGE